MGVFSHTIAVAAVAAVGHRHVHVHKPRASRPRVSFHHAPRRLPLTNDQTRATPSAEERPTLFQTDSVTQ